MSSLWPFLEWVVYLFVISCFMIILLSCFPFLSIFLSFFLFSFLSFFFFCCFFFILFFIFCGGGGLQGGPPPKKKPLPCGKVVPCCLQRVGILSLEQGHGKKPTSRYSLEAASELIVKPPFARSPPLSYADKTTSRYSLEAVPPAEPISRYINKLLFPRSRK